MARKNSNSHHSNRKTLATFSAGLLTLALSGCAHMGSNSGQGTPRSPAQPDPGVVAPDAPPTAADLNDTGADLRAVPMAVNRQVLVWIDYFQGKGRPHMERYLSRSTRYMPVMKKILKENGLPEDLIYIALIESGFSSTAHSSASAVGYWQFIRGTGKRYNLRIDTYVDDRRDFIFSTQAAADYFKGLYGMFHSWYLAIASYNVGENRVKNLVMKNRTRDFWQLARENKLPAETSNYVPKYIAARLIAKDPEKYGFSDIDYMPPLEWDDVELTTSIDIKKLAQGMGLEYDDLRDLNPSYKRGVAFDKEGKLKLRVPKGSAAAALAAAGQAVPENRKVYVADEDYSYYKIRRGDTISTIARKFNTSQRNIRELNKLGPKSPLIAGRRLRVPAENVAGLSKRESSRKSQSQKAPLREAAKEPNRSDASSAGPKPSLGLAAAQKYMEPSRVPQSAPRESQRIYIVRSGDTLIDIARRYRVSLRELTRHNRIGRRSKISVGTRLEIPR